MSKKELRPIQLQGGVSRLHNAAQTRPRNLENCQMMINGFVRSVNDPNKITPEVSSTKPYVEWNGKVLDREGWSQEEDGGQVSGRVLDNASLNARLYRSVQSTDSSGTNYRVVKHFADYDVDISTTDGFQGEPAIVYNKTITIQDFTDYDFVTASVDATTVEVDIHSGYIAIPYDKNGEIGPWFHFTVNKEVKKVNAGAPVINLVTPVDVTLSCNEHVTKVDIYRTMDFNDRGFLHGGPVPLSAVTVGDGEIPAGFYENNDYFYFGTFTPSINSSTSARETVFRDDEVWINDTLMAVFKDEVAYVLTTDEGLVWALPFLAPYNTINNVIKVPSTLLDVQRNFNSVHTDDVGSEDYQYHGVVGNVMSTQGDIVLYGDVKYPTKRPTTGLMLYKSTIPFSNIEAQLEYLDNNGNVYYGPKETFTAVESIKFAWQGENALLIFRGGDLFERLTPNVSGVYKTSFQQDELQDEGFIPSVSYIVNADNSSVTYDEDPGATLTDYISEPNAVFLSQSGRGMEISFDSFFLKSDEVVRSIMAARLAENESIRDYDFYVFTDKSITLYKRTGSDLRTILPVHNVTTSFGVEQNTFTHKSGEDPTTHTLITNTRFGIAFVGTDGNVWSLIGRDLVQLDIEIPGLFLTDVRDIEYHPSKDELWVLVGPATIWVYSFIQQGWVKNYNTIYIHYNLYYNKTRKVLTSYGDEFLTLYNLDFDDDCDNIHNSPQLTTQPFGEDGTEFVVDQMEVDYITETYDDRDRDTWGILRHSVRSRKISDVEETYGSGNGNILVQYNIPSNRSIYPTLVGRGHKFKFSNFHEFRGFEIKIRKSGS